jgi:bla regulator protein blaR1
MRTDAREMLAVGICGRGSELGNRIEALLRRGHFTARASAAAVISGALGLGGLMVAGSFAPRWMAFAQNRSAFDAVSIRPDISGTDQIVFGPPAGNRFSASNVTLRMLIKRAYKVKEFELAGGPDWAESSRFDVSATASGPALTEPEFKTMLQGLLADRFRLRAHQEARPMPVYFLTSVKDGMKLPKPTGSCVDPGSLAPGVPGVVCGGFVMNDGVLDGRRISMEQFVTALSNFLGRPVMDKTAYAGAFDLHLEFTFQGIAQVGGGGFGTPTIPASAGADTRPTIFSAIQTQLGLKLESARGTGEVLVIDHAEKPDAN